MKRGPASGEWVFPGGVPVQWIVVGCATPVSNSCPSDSRSWRNVVLQCSNSAGTAVALTNYLASMHWHGFQGDCAPAVLVLPPFGRSHIAPGGGADGECDVPQERSSTTVRWGEGHAPLEDLRSSHARYARTPLCPHPPGRYSHGPLYGDLSSFRSRLPALRLFSHLKSG